MTHAGVRREQCPAVVVTRGDVDLNPVLRTLDGFGEILVYDNSVEADLMVLGRYAAIDRCSLPGPVYVQDDDAEVNDIDALLSHYEPGLIVSNMPRSRWDDYPDSCLVGWGAVFDQDLPRRAFARWTIAGHKMVDHRFYRDCDVVFTALTPHVKLDLGFSHLPWAEADYRMFRQPEHSTRAQTLAEARAIRGPAPTPLVQRPRPARIAPPRLRPTGDIHRRHDG